MIFDVLILQFVKSLKDANFPKYIASLDSLMDWVCASAHHHYTKNLPVHLRDMVTLEEVHPGIYAEFMEGKFVAQKTKRSFSAMGFDQTHEQLNDWLKNESGTIGNLDDPQTCLREQVTRPEMARCLTEIQWSKPAKDSENDSNHHEMYLQYQKKFQVTI